MTIKDNLKKLIEENAALKFKIQELEHSASEHKRTEEAVQNNRAIVNSIINGTSDAIYAKDLLGRYILFNAAAEKLMSMSKTDVLGKDDSIFFPKPDDLNAILENDRKVIEEGVVKVYEENGTIATGPKTVLSTKGPLIDDEKTIGIFGITRDITDRKRAEEELKDYASELEDTNTALRVFMSRRDSDQKILEEKLLLNISELVLPYLKKLSQTTLDSRQQNYLNVLESNLNNIVSPHMLNLSVAYKNLTPQEIQIANLIRQGKNTKEMADLIHVSEHTIGTHRNNIRKKLQLRNSKTNLRSHLLSL